MAIDREMGLQRLRFILPGRHTQPMLATHPAPRTEGVPTIAGLGSPLRIATRPPLFKPLLQREFFAALATAFPAYQLTPEVEKQLGVTYPKLADHGDYAIPVFALSKAIRQAPATIAEKIASEMRANPDINRYFDINVINGYINFRFSDAFLMASATSLDSTFGNNDTLAGQTIQVEWVSANPTGPLHIGHARWAVMGDLLCKMLEACGATVQREFYVNDAGAQIERFRKSVQAAKEGSAIPEDGYHGQYIYEIAKQGGDPVLLMMEYQRLSLEAIGVHFDRWFSEKTLYIPDAEGRTMVDKGLAILEAAHLTYRAAEGEQVDEEINAPVNRKGQAQTGEALWFRSTQFGDTKDRVLIKANGAATYFLGDIAYHLDKVGRGFDFLFNILGADHGGYVARLSAAIQALSDGKQGHHIIIGQLVKLLKEDPDSHQLVEARMSKRTGEMVSLGDITEAIGADAVRVFMGSAGFDTAVNINLDVATKKSSDNPVFYIQYAHARIAQLLKKAQEQGITPATTIPADYRLNTEERALLAAIYKIPDEILEAADAQATQRILQFTMDLATRFHAFYHAHHIVNEHDLPTSQARLALCQATAQVLKNVFALMGISAPEEMAAREEAPV
ncbi:MAG: arginine--tRNA ligase [Candidatus Margulisiibacteriota bacterium]